MDALTLLLAVAAAAALGAFAAWVVRERALARLREERGRLQADVARLQTTIEKERQAAAEKLRLLDEPRTSSPTPSRRSPPRPCRTTTPTSSASPRRPWRRSRRTARGDLELRQQAIDELVLPLKESLQQVDQKIQEIETARAVAYTRPRPSTCKSLAASQADLERETAKLVSALRAPARAAAGGRSSSSGWWRWPA